jgi:hypothetical protein
MASAGTSRFVHCMKKLNADIWADVLLPMLRKDKSAAAVAASCSTLRKLCQGAVRHLIFTPAARSGDLATVKRNVAALHQHFSALKGVGIALARDDLYVLAPAIMEGLSRQVWQWHMIKHEQLSGLHGRWQVALSLLHSRSVSVPALGDAVCCLHDMLLYTGVVLFHVRLCSRVADR